MHWLEEGFYEGYGICQQEMTFKCKTCNFRQAFTFSNTAEFWVKTKAPKKAKVSTTARNLDDGCGNMDMSL